MIAKKVLTGITALLLIVFSWPVHAMDSEVTRETLSGLTGFYVAFEELQPNIKQYAFAALLTRDQLQKDIEMRLQRAKITVLSQTQWLNTRGRPVLYGNVNTHLEDANIAYNIQLEARQIVFTDSNKKVKTLAGTWGIIMTGITKTDKLDVIRENLLTLVDKFVEAYWTANGKDSKK